MMYDALKLWADSIYDCQVPKLLWNIEIGMW